MAAQWPEGRASTPRDALAARLKHCRRLPTLPGVALQLVDLAEDASASLQQFEALIARDPALAGKLMRVANSSFYGRPRTASNLSQAVNLLGLNATVALALGFSLRASVAARCSEAFDVAAYWRRSLLTAFAARSLAVALREPQPEDFLLAGLLQDVGVLAMDAMSGDAYAALHGASTSHADLLRREAAAFDFTHVDAGGGLLRQWQLPGFIADSVRLSHDTATLSAVRADDEGRLPCCVAVAARIADAWMARATPEALVPAGEAAGAWLGIGTEQFQAVIEAMAGQMPDMERLFDTQLADPAVVEDVRASAGELLVLRSLRSPAGADARDRIQTLERRTATLEDQTQRDAMTGLYNRAYLERVLEREFDRATRDHHPLSIAFIDVDRFKSINDTFGHAVGDEVLITVARRLLAGARQGDTVTRYGGEEFVILLRDTGADQARTIMERILASVRDMPFHTRGGATGTVAFSVGVATHLEGAQAFDSASTMLEAADRALYAAKRAGRARIVMAEQGGREP